MANLRKYLYLDIIKTKRNRYLNKLVSNRIDEQLKEKTNSAY